MRLLLAAAAAFALTLAAPALADGGCKNCKDCPHMAQADPKAGDKGDKKDEKALPACPCAGGEGKECKCAAGCHCPHCHAKAEQKAEKKS